MLSIDILGVSSAHEGFRFVTGDDIPSVVNTYAAQLDGNTPTRVEFELGGQTITDNSSDGGWTADFDMSTLAADTDLTVRAYEGTTLGDTFNKNVDLLILPDWFHNPGGDSSTGTTFTASHDWSTGYHFDVTVNHLDLGFNTPADWVFYVPGVSEPVFDLAGKRTGFAVDSSFQITSQPSGLVDTTGCQFHILAEVLGNTAYDDTFAFSVNDTLPFEEDYGPVHVEGSVSYFADVTPQLGDDLVFEGIGGSAWLDPSLTITMPLGEARIPAFSIPGMADMALDASAEIGFGKLDGQAHMFSITPAATSTTGGFQIESFQMNPSLSVAIGGGDELDLGWGDGTAGASLAGMLEQGLVSHYDNVSGWANSAPGSLTLSGDTHYNTLWSYGPSGAMDRFAWELASWDFLAATGGSLVATQQHTYESGALANPWKSSTAGPHDSLTLTVDYHNPGVAPQEARLLVDQTTVYEMTLLTGTADSGTYSVVVPGVAVGGHEYRFLFVDAAGEYHVQGFDMGPDRVRVLHVEPAHGGPMVAQDANVTIEFSDPMDPRTLNAATIQVVGSSSGLHDGSYQYGDNTLVIDPAADFAPGETVTVTVTRDASSFDGCRVAEDYVFSFWAIDATPTPIEVGGTLTESTTWTSGNVYVVTSDLTVPLGTTLSIDPGVVVKAMYGRSMVVYGGLVLNSTPDNKVVFTSYLDDTYGGDSNGDGSASSPSRGDWEKICLGNSQPKLFHDAIVRYGGYPNCGVLSASSTTEIRDCLIEHNFTGITVGSGSPVITGNTLSGNIYPFYQLESSNPVCIGNVLRGNSYHAVAVGGYIYSPTTWKVMQEGIPYLLVNDLRVDYRATLTIEGGVVVKAFSGRCLSVSGGLLLNSTPDNNVVFTSYLDDTYGGDTNGDGSASSADLSDWGGVSLRGTEPVVFHDAIVRYAGHSSTGYMAAVQVSRAASTEIRDCLIEQSHIGIKAASGSPVITGNTIEHNDTGIKITAGSPVITDNTLTGNTYPLYEEGSCEPAYNGNVLINNTYHAIAVSGHLVSSTTWAVAQEDIPYLLTYRMTVDSGATLTIDGGVVVKAQAGGHLHVAGDLVLNSTPENKVVFTSYRDDTYGGDTNGDGSASSPSPGDWESLYLIGNQPRVFHDAIVRYAECAVEVYGTASTEIRDCLIEQSEIGIKVWSGSPTITGNTFSGNTYPIYQNGSSDPVYNDNVLAGNSYNAIAVGGGISSSHTWEVFQEGIPYLLAERFTVYAGATLTIEAGVVVKGEGYAFLAVEGGLVLNSTPENKVVFTSYRDDTYGGDTNGDGSDSSPSPKDWEGIVLYNTEPVVFHDAIVRYGGYASSGAVYVSSAAGTEIRDCLIEHSYIGIKVGSSSPVITGNTLSENTYPLYKWGSCKPAYSGNVLTGNSYHAIAVGGTIDSSTTWEVVQAGIPYLLADSVTVRRGATLAIEGGVVMKGERYKSLQVFGGLVLNSTPENKVVFTSYRDDTYGGDTNRDGSESSPSPNDWSGIYLYNNEPVVFHDAIVRYGGSALRVSGAETTEIRDCLIEQSDIGIKVASGSPVITGNALSGNAYPLFEQGSCEPAYSGNVLTGNSYNAIAVGWTISSSTTWGLVQGGDIPYLLAADVTVWAGATLTIEGGVVVKAMHSRSLQVDGGLVLNSTPENKVVFTSYRDDTYGGDTNGDGSASSPSRSDWGPISLGNNEPVVFHDAIVRYAGSYSFGAVSVSGAASTEIRDCLIEQSYTGIKVASGSPVITGNTLSGNTYPLCQEGSSDPVYSGNVLISNSCPAITVTGDMDASTTWEVVQEGIPYLLASSLTINAGATLTIEGGVVVKAKRYGFLRVYGGLVLNSTPDNKVVFTSYPDDTYGGDTNGDGSMSSPSCEDWGGIFLVNDEPVVFHDAIVRYGGYDDFAALYVSGAATTEIRDCLIEQSSVGIKIASGSPVITGNTLSGHTYPIYEEGSCDPVYSGNVLTDNSYHAIAVGGSMDSSTTWEVVQEDLPYLLVDDRFVGSGATLTIDGGVVVKAKSYKFLRVSGGLVLNSTPDNKVVFTSYRDDTYGGDTNGDGSVSNPYRQDWRGILLYNNEPVVFHDAIVRYAGSYSFGAVHVSSAASTEIRDCSIEQSYAGIKVTSGSPVIAGNTLSGNTFPLYENGSCDPVYSGNVLTDNTYHAIAVGGNMGSSTTWEVVQGGIPYLLTDYPTVGAGATLTIEGGVVVKVTSSRLLRVDGGLVLNSTPDNKVVFTSYRDDTYGGDTNGDGSASSPSPQDWRGISLYNNEPVVFHDAIVRYGGYDDSAALYVSGTASTEIRDCLIEQSYTGIKVASGSPVIVGNTLSGNMYPFYEQGPCEPTYSENVLTGNTYHAIGVGGSMDSSTIWKVRPGRIPYLLAGDLTVQAGATLIIDGGVVVKSRSGTRLIVQGTYITADAVENPVVFTSYRDDSYGGDTNGDGWSSGSPGDWDGVVFESTDNVFEHTLVRYAGATVAGPDVAIRHVTFDHAPDPAVRIQSGGSGTTIHNVNFLHWSGDGVRNDTDHTIDARGNYWGDPTGPGGAGPGSGAGVTGNVLYDPWLTSPAVGDGDGPVITSSPHTAAVVLYPYRYDADSRASANGSGVVVWTKILGPEDFHIDTNTGEITWAPIEPGDYVVGIAASDEVGTTDQIWQIHVDVTGDTTPPQIAGFRHAITDEGGGLVTAELVATFNEGVQVRPIDVALFDAGGDPVTVTSLSYEVATHEVTIVAEHLTEDASYTLRLLDTITDDALNPLDGEFDGHSFPTGNGSPGGRFEVPFLAHVNAAPVADAGGPYIIEAGEELALDGSGSYDPDAGYGDSIVAYEWDLDNDGDFSDATGVDPLVPWTTLEDLGIPVGERTIAVRVVDSFGATGIDTAILSIRRPVILYFAMERDGSLGGHGFADEDIIGFDGSEFSMVFDGSLAGIPSYLRLDAFAVTSPSEILMSLATSGSIAGLGFVDAADVLKFTATEFGETTAGMFELYFDGSDVGLSFYNENVDAIARLDDGRLLLSTTGAFNVPGVAGGAEDLLAFTPTSLGMNTAGTWELYFDGSDVGLSGFNENVDAVGLDSGGNIYLSTAGGFSVPGLAGADEDAFVFEPTSLGSNTAGSYRPVLHFDGSPYGLGSNDLVAINARLPNEPPAAAGDAYHVDADGTLIVSPATGVLANDHDANDDPFYADLVGGPSQALTFTLKPDGSFGYVPDPSFSGTDSFTYRAYDGKAYSNEATVTIIVARPLDPIDFLRLDGQDPSDGELWYRFETTRQGFLTAEAIFEGTPDSVALALYDGNRTDPPLAVSTLVDGGRRIDREAGAGETYYLKLTGTSTDVDLRLTNLVSHVGTVVTVYGTDANDQFEFDAAASRRVTINGVGYEFDDAEVTSVSFDGAAGDDTATLTGSAADETVLVYPTRATWTGPVGVSVVNTAQITVHSGGGSDTAKLYDSPGDDMLIVTPDEASLTGPGYSNQVVGFGFAMGIAREDGYDTAKLYDSPGEDTFLGTPTYSKMSAGDETYGYAKSFEHVIAYSRTGRDAAVLKDSPGDDKFVGRSTYGKLSGPGFKVQAQWFDTLEACANSLGDDRAYLFDSPGDDWFIGDSTEAVMRGVGFHNTARWFETAFGYGTGGGMDRAIFYDSLGNDTFVGTATRGRLTGPGYYLQAVRCDVVRAFSQSGGQDKARLFDSAGDDVLIATPEYSYLRGSPSTGNFKNRADGFAEVESTARFGGNDTAQLYDSALDDYLHAEGNSAVMTWDATRVLSAYDFDHVEAGGSQGGVNKLKKVLPIDYLLTVTGDWTEL